MITEEKEKWVVKRPMSAVMITKYQKNRDINMPNRFNEELIDIKMANSRASRNNRIINRTALT